MVSESQIRRLATGVALICVALVVCTLAFGLSPRLRKALGFGPTTAASYTVGEQVDLPSAEFEAAPITVVLFARSTCGTCQRSAPTFAAMFGQVRPDPGVRIRLIANGANHVDEVAYAHTVGLGEPDMRTLDVTHLRLRVVPTLLLLDRRGTIHYSSEGLPSPAQQDEFQRAVTSLSAER